MRHCQNAICLPIFLIKYVLVGDTVTRCQGQHSARPCLEREAEVSPDRYNWSMTPRLCNVGRRAFMSESTRLARPLNSVTT